MYINQCQDQFERLALPDILQDLQEIPDFGISNRELLCLSLETIRYAENKKYTVCLSVHDLYLVLEFLRIPDFRILTVMFSVYWTGNNPDWKKCKTSLLHIILQCWHCIFYLVPVCMGS